MTGGRKSKKDGRGGIAVHRASEIGDVLRKQLLLNGSVRCRKMSLLILIKNKDINARVVPRC